LGWHYFEQFYGAEEWSAFSPHFINIIFGLFCYQSHMPNQFSFYQT